MHNLAETYKPIINPEIQRVCHLLSPAFEPNAIHSFLTDNHPEKIYGVLLRHRLFPSFYRKWPEVCDVNSLPPEWVQFSQQLRQKAEVNRMHMLQKTTILLSIADAFAQTQIPMLPLKGPVLAYQLYGDVGLKASQDIDILIPKEYFTLAWETLKLLGFSTDFNYALSPRQKNYLLNSFHHLTFVKESSQVELHWEINTNRFMTGRPNTEYFQNAVPITIAGKAIQTLHTDHLIEYLAIHGSYHAWYRLDWLYDFSQAITQNSDSLLQISQRINNAGLGIIFDQSITLANLLFAAPVPDNKQKSSFLIRVPLKTMSNSLKNATYPGLSRITQKIYLFKLKRSWKYRIHVFSVLGTNQGNWKMLKLPDKLFFLYFMLRPVLYVWQIVSAKPLSRKG